MKNNELLYFKMFRDVCKVINSTLDLKEVLQLINRNVINALNVKGCTIFLLNRVHKELEVASSHGVSESYLRKGPVDADKSIGDSLSGKSVLIYDVAKDSRLQYPGEAKKEGIASIFSVPISVKGKIIGVLRIYTSECREFSNDEVEFILGLAEMGGIAIDNARMYNHLQKNHEQLINDTQRWFEFGKGVLERK
ncbi:GAF domain-containing protein [Candidatus Magnetomoraceae bacterium gMMP-15]